MKPLIRRSGLSNPPRYYLLTRYRIDGDAVIASTKYDITDEIEALGLAAPPAPLPLDVERLAHGLRLHASKHARDLFHHLCGSDCAEEIVALAPPEPTEDDDAVERDDWAAFELARAYPSGWFVDAIEAQDSAYGILARLRMAGYVVARLATPEPTELTAPLPLAEALHNAMCTISHHDRGRRCSEWAKYPNIAASVVRRLAAPEPTEDGG